MGGLGAADVKVLIHLCPMQAMGEVRILKEVLLCKSELTPIQNLFPPTSILWEFSRDK